MNAKTIESVKDLLDIVQEYVNTSVIYRGVESSEYELLSKIGRRRPLTPATIVQPGVLSFHVAEPNQPGSTGIGESRAGSEGSYGPGREKSATPQDAATYRGRRSPRVRILKLSHFPKSAPPNPSMNHAFFTKILAYPRPPMPCESVTTSSASLRTLR